MHHKGTATPIGSLEENSSDTFQPPVAQLDVSPALNVVVGAMRRPQIGDPLA